MSLAACAEIVSRGDPDRFLAAMAAPPEARERLFPLYAFNLEVARAPWVSPEPMIGQMRLQFWRDVLAEIGAGDAPRAHEVVRPLAEVLRETGLPVAPLDDIVRARWTDLERAPFADAAALDAYLDATSGQLMWASVTALGGGVALEAPARAVGRASGLANWLMAVPELEARGWPARPEGLAGLITRARAELAAARATRFGPGLPAIRAAWRAAAVLARAARRPAAIASGELEGAEITRRGSLLVKSLTGRW
ncbi:squalene/phytoene synthase family protein [Maritimibacter sp. HL-12]|uniref:squalene/phytoene synthase family protein n=1 Tax=Maritimibacter sp. HL-12 TaxID=1162418 RepID=UPI000A0F33B3|nr:squalene/phytoene synthase family protein [Maritimibacter sp. HL-12]SMH57344.1 Phytoene/squalene synthetase [Maritimibacter sp. HL-12]